MERNDLEKFKKISYDFLSLLEIGFGLHPYVINNNAIEVGENFSPSITVRFRDKGLKRYTMGIWACGKWSDYYDCEGINRISVFMIHDWLLDKFRPSSANLIYELYLEPEFYRDNIHSEMFKQAKMIEEVNKNPIDTYYAIKEFHEFPNATLDYIHEWYYYCVEKRFANNLRYKWSVKFLYSILWIISKFDPRVKKSILFNDEGVIPPLTSSFLATEKCADNDKSWERFKNLYERFPKFLRKTFKYKLFDSGWNVADYSDDMTEKEIRTRMWKGCI